MKYETSVKMVPFWNLHFNPTFQIIINPDDIDIHQLREALNSGNSNITFCNGCIRVNVDTGYFSIRGLQMNEHQYITGNTSEMSYIVKSNVSKHDILLTLDYYIHLIENL